MAIVSEETSQRILDYGLLVYKYYTPFIFSVGIVGNLLSILVFIADPKYRRKSSSCYLAALAISDTGYLLTLFAIWLGALNDGVITSTFICPFVMYVGQVTSFTSVYLTVAFSVERYIAIYYPLKKLLYCTLSNARKVITGIVAISLFTFSYVWFVAELVQVQEQNVTSFVCTVWHRNHSMSEVANYIDSFFTLIIPFLVITVLNLKIAMKLYGKMGSSIPVSSAPFNYRTVNGQQIIEKIELPKLKYRTRDVVHVIHIPIAFADGIKVIPKYGAKVSKHQCANMYRTKLTETRVTRTLVLVSVVFLCLNAPQHVLRCTRFIQAALADWEGIKLSFAFQPWAQILFNTNFAVNFVLYCMSGSGFRNSLRHKLAQFFSKFVSLKTYLRGRKS